MRALILLATLFLSSMPTLADVQWHKFSLSGGEKDTIKVDRVSVSVQTREVREAAFREDYLVMTVSVPGQKPSEYWFTSSYGCGEVAVDGNLLLLKYGVGRGTFARVEHVRVLRMKPHLEELVDVQSSYYLVTHARKMDPDLFEYRLKLQTDRGYTTLTFSLPKPQRGLTAEKVVRLKNDD